MSYKFHRDKYGLIVQPVGYLATKQDGGDSLCFTAIYKYLTNNAGTTKFRALFECPKCKGIYRRHPDPAYSEHGWASQCNVESRDQMSARLCYQALRQDRPALKSSLYRHMLRGMLFACNTIKNGSNPKTAKWKLPDFTGPDIWALYIRGLRLRILYPLLFIFDLQLLASALINRHKENDDDIINHLLRCILANQVMPTPIMWLVNRVISREQTMKKLQSYWGGWRKQPGFVILYRPYVMQYFKGA